MLTNPLISIALCTHNGARYLPEQLDSLLTQDYPSLEIIIYDDCSSDNSWPILQDYASRDARIKLFKNETNIGFIANFERAISNCQGALIAPCDQDDIWLPNKISTLALAIDNYSACYCDSALMDEHGSDLHISISDRMHMYEGTDPTAFIFSNCVSGHALLFRRELLEHALPFPQVSYHDWWLAFIATSFNGICFVPEKLVRFRQHENSCTDINQLKKNIKPKKDALTSYEETEIWLRHLKRPETKHQTYFSELHQAWKSRSQSLFCWNIYKLLSQKRESLFYISGKKMNEFKLIRYVWGIPLKQLFRPHRYPRRPLKID